jgi:ABC-type branched-subunit amino acid transport system permease subunit
MVILALTLLGCFCLMALQMEHRRSSLVFLHVSGVPRSTIYALLTGEAGAVVFGAAVIGAGGSITILNWGLSALAAQLPVSLPPPHLGVVLSAGLAALCVVILAGTVTGVALGVVAHRLRGVGNRPVG